MKVKPIYDWAHRREPVAPVYRTRAMEFDNWLSPDVMGLLIREYAAQPQNLRWLYGPLPANTWGKYSPRYRHLIVNKAKTKGNFRQQLKTILHEIQHANQHAKHPPGSDWIEVYKEETASRGYLGNPYEVDARRFADQHLDEAFRLVTRHYGSKVDGGLDEVVEELFDTAEEGNLTRLQVGQALRDFDLNSPANMATVITALRDLGIRVL